MIKGTEKQSDSAQTVSPDKWLWEIWSETGPSETNTRAVLAAIRKRMNKKGFARPTIDQIAMDTGLTEKTVRTHLEIAEDLGFLVIESDEGEGLRKRRNRYFASLPDNSRGPRQ